MEKAQADEISKAILEPHLQAQEARSAELRAMHAAEEVRQVRKRQAAWFLLAGAGIGAVISYFGGVRFTQGVVWGGLAGAAIGWLVTRRAA
jgi:hypothetical protein